MALPDLRPTPPLLRLVVIADKLLEGKAVSRLVDSLIIFQLMLRWWTGTSNRLYKESCIMLYFEFLLYRKSQSYFVGIKYETSLASRTSL